MEYTNKKVVGSIIATVLTLVIAVGIYTLVDKEEVIAYSPTKEEQVEINSKLFFELEGKIVEREKIRGSLIAEWEERVIHRISKRVIKHIQKEKKDSHHPETLFPPPQYLIEVNVENIVDLTPETIIVEISGDEDKVQSLIELLRGFGLVELARTGRIAITRGALGPLQKPDHDSIKKPKPRKPKSSKTAKT